MKLELLGSKVCVLVYKLENKTASGILLPPKEEPLSRGLVVKKGLKCEDETVVEGDVVIFDTYIGTDLDLEGVMYKILDEGALMAVVPDE